MKCKGVWTLYFFLCYNRLTSMSILVHPLAVSGSFIISLTHPSLHNVFLSWKLFWDSSNCAKVDTPWWKVFRTLNYFESALCVKKFFTDCSSCSKVPFSFWRTWKTAENDVKILLEINLFWVLSHSYILSGVRIFESLKLFCFKKNNPSCILLSTLHPFIACAK